jgi:Ca-activated chloride channel family protein
VRVSVLGVGSAQGAPVALAQGGFLKNAAGDIVLPKLDASSLANLADAGGGQYVAVGSDAADLDALLATPAAQSTAQARATALTTTRFRDRGPWLLLALLPLVALGFRRGWLMLVPLMLLAHAPNAAAFSWRDLWQSPDAQARAELDAGDAKQAQTLARDPQLRGAAAYRAGDFAAAAQDFARGADTEAAYNRGNALAKQKQYHEAIAAYDEALQHTPDMADALANKRAVEEWLKKQADQQQHDQQQRDQQQQNQQQQDQQQNGSSGDQPKQDQQQTQGNSAQDGQQGKQQSAPGRQSADDAGAKAEQEKAGEDRRQAEQKYRENMDRELQQQRDADQRGAPKPVRLGAREDNAAQDEHAQAVEQWLQRVPDDPGGLLRRKFQLEYQLRQHGGGRPGDGGR